MYVCGWHSRINLPKTKISNDEYVCVYIPFHVENGFITTFIRKNFYLSENLCFSLYYYGFFINIKFKCVFNIKYKYLFINTPMN